MPKNQTYIQKLIKFMDKKVTPKALSGADEVYYTKKGAIAIVKVKGVRDMNNKLKYKKTYSYYPNQPGNERKVKEAFGSISKR